MRILVSLAVLAYVAIIAALSAWTDSSLEWILTEWKGQPVEVHGGLSFLVTLICPFILLFNVVVQVLRTAS